MTINRTHFAADLEGGMNVNKLAKKYGVAWITASNLAKEIRSGAGGDEAPAAADPEAAPAEKESEFFEITVRVLKDRVIEMVRSAESDEILTAIEMLEPGFHADILQAIMQARTDKMLLEMATGQNSIAIMPAVGSGG